VPAIHFRHGTSSGFAKRVFERKGERHGRKSSRRSILTLIKRDDTGFSVLVALYDDIM
jgi:hypothetical protein